MTETRALIQCDNGVIPAGLENSGWDYRRTIRSRGPNSDLNFRAASLAGVVLDSVQGRAADLVKIGAFVYGADQVVSRGGRSDVYGTKWRRHMELCIPVSEPDFWGEEQVRNAVTNALGFLTDDHWVLHFSPATSETLQIPLELTNKQILDSPDTVMLFSGGADSLCAAVEVLTTPGRRPVLVSHRSSPLVDSRQRRLTNLLRRRFHVWDLPHLSFWIHRRHSEPSDTSQRSRGFLFACLGVAVATQLDITQVLMGENGFVSINPPISGQLVGALASRATHPGFLARFNRLCDFVAPGVTVSNPLWSRTRAETLDILKSNQCDNLLLETISCGHTRGLPAPTPQCGYCSQCIDRRLGTIAAGLETYDPPNRYYLDIFTDALEEGEPRTVAESLVRFSRRIQPLSLESIMLELPELAECIHPSDSDPDRTARALTSLVKRSCETVLRVLDMTIQRYSDSLARGVLPADSLLRLATGGEQRVNPVDSTGREFIRTGEYWSATYAGFQANFRDSLGMQFIARLLKHPNREFTVADLESGTGSLSPPASELRRSPLSPHLVSEGLRPDQPDVQPQIDERARAEYTARIEELESKLAAAEAAGDPETVYDVRAEISALREHVQVAVGRSGESRSFSGPGEQLRQRVTRATRRALRQIETFHPTLGRHLRGTLSIARSSSYRPENDIEWVVSIDAPK